MAYEKVTDLSTDTVVGMGNKPGQEKKIEGYYLGKRTVENKDGSGNSVIHVFQTPGGNTGVWGKADLNNKLSGVKLGTCVLVEFDSIAKLKGGKTMYKFNVLKDSENVIAVGETAYDDTSYADNNDSDDNVDGFYKNEGTDEEGDGGPVYTAPKKRTLEDLLKKGKRLT